MRLSCPLLTSDLSKYFLWVGSERASTLGLMKRLRANSDEHGCTPLLREILRYNERLLLYIYVSLVCVINHKHYLFISPCNDVLDRATQVFSFLLYLPV